MFVDALARVPLGDYVWVEGVGVGGGGVVWSVGVNESSVDDHPFLDTLRACKQVFPTVARAMGAYLPREWTVAVSLR